MTTDFSGNRGEWCEPYVMLKCLADGRIYGADENQERKETVFYEVRKVVRTDGNRRIDYILDDNRKMVRITSEGRVLKEESVSEFARQNGFLFDSILNGKGRAFTIPDTERFLRSIGVSSLKSPSIKKVDIVLEIFEPQVGIDIEQGFSIKSKLKAPATLINASRQTNFEYRVVGGLDDGLAERINRILTSGERNRYNDAFGLMDSNGLALEFNEVCSDVYGDNLMMISSDSQRIAAEMVRLWFWERRSDMASLAERMTEMNMLGFRNPSEKPYYKRRIQEILTKHALGLKPGVPWGGDEEAKGGYIIVKMNGEIVCYHIYDREEFMEYLFRNTHMDTPKQDRNDFGVLYKRDGGWFIRLNLQVRFY